MLCMNVYARVCVFVSFAVGIITTLLMQTGTANAQYQQKLDMVNKYMSHRRLPHHLRQRIRDSYEYRWYSKQVLDEVRAQTRARHIIFVFAEFERPKQNKLRSRSWSVPVPPVVRVFGSRVMTVPTT